MLNNLRYVQNTVNVAFPDKSLGLSQAFDNLISENFEAFFKSVSNKGSNL